MKLGFRYPGFQEDDDNGPQLGQPDPPQNISAGEDKVPTKGLTEAHILVRERIDELTLILIDSEFSSLSENVRIAKVKELRMLQAVDNQLEFSY